MTARHQLRIGSRRLGRDRHVIDATPAPSLGEVLQTARERKGVDLFRAERDTKIRLKYLAALEDDDLAELPPPVYTKGFIRNYALYLGLEPEDVIGRWRDQLLLQRRQEKVTVAPPPQPLAAPRRGFSITPGMIVALMLSVVVVAFLGYIGWQVARFAGAPDVSLTHPQGLVSQVDAESITLAGTAGLAARITIQAADGQVFTATASSSDGSWSRSVPLSKGRNDFRIVARDPITERDSEPLNVIITVPLPDVTGPPSIGPTPVAISVRLSSPTDGLTSNDGLVTVAGTTTGTRIMIDAELVGPLPGASPTAEPEPSTETTPEPTPTPGGSPTAQPTPALPLDITVPIGGAFNETLRLEAGVWQITVTTYATGREPVSETRQVTVDDSLPVGDDELTLVVEARGGSSWMRIVVDGVQLRPREWGGPTLSRGEVATISAEREIFLRTGNAGVVHVTLNGRDLGMLGRRGQVGNWLIVPGSDPQSTSETR